MTWYFGKTEDRPARETPSGIRYETERSFGGARFSSLPETGTVHGNMVIPETIYEALMQTDFMEEPKESIEEGEDRRRKLMAALEEILTLEELVVIQAVILSDLMLHEAGELLAFEKRRGKAYGKAYAHALRERGLQKIRAAIEEGTLNEEHLGTSLSKCLSVPTEAVCG